MDVQRYFEQCRKYGELLQRETYRKLGIGTTTLVRSNELAQVGHPRSTHALRLLL